MKKVILLSVMLIMSLSICYSQDYTQIGIEYSKAIFENKTPAARIGALKALVKKFTDTSNTFVKLSYYQLTVNYFENKSYGEAVKYGQKRLGLGPFGTGEEARLHLVMSNSYAIKSSPVYNKSKAMSHSKKALAIAKTEKAKDLVQAANNLISKLSTPKTPKMRPEKKIQIAYQDEDYAQVIAEYKKAGSDVKSIPEIHQLYAYALLNSKKTDAALKEFSIMYANKKKARIASKIGEIYAKKGKKSKVHYDNAVKFYLEANILFLKEGNTRNAKTAYQSANYWLSEKYGYNQKVDQLKSMVRKEQGAVQKNIDAKKKKEREIRKLDRSIERDYSEMEPPKYLTDKLEKTKRELQNLKSGVSTQSSSKAKELENEKKKIDKELRELKKETKKRLDQ